MQRKAEDLTGQRYGRLVAVSRDNTTRQHETMWDCLCDCGGVKSVRRSALKTGHTKSCGCYEREHRTTHGLYSANKNEYWSWTAMRRRCSDKKFSGYKYYGGRGISVCDRWVDSFKNFLEDMGEEADQRPFD